MRRLMFCFLCLGLIFVMSCEIPQSITVKGSPSLKVSLGSPFKGEDKKSLNDYISKEKIAEMMNDTGNPNEVIVDYYEGPSFPGVQTYIVHYPITRMTLDLEEYVNNATTTTPGTKNYDIPSIVKVDSFPSWVDYYYITDTAVYETDPHCPLYKIDLSDMANLVVEVRGRTDVGNEMFGIEIPYDKNVPYERSFRKNLQIKIPAFGIEYDDPVTVDVANGMLRFAGTADGGRFRPSDTGVLSPNNELEIFVRLAGPCDDRTISITPIFNWEEATINPSNMKTHKENLKGEYSISYNFREFLGSAEFLNVEGYVYVAGVGKRASMKLWINSEAPFESGKLEPSSFGLDGDKELLEASRAPIPLAWVLNKYDDGFNLGYHIEIEEWTVYSYEGRTEEITADLVILLPMRLKISSPDPHTPPYNEFPYTQYVKLDFKDIFDDSGNEDLFGRDGSDNFFDSIEQVTISLDNKNIGKAVTESRLAIRLTNNNPAYAGILYLGDARPSLLIPKAALNPPPFAPKFEVLYKKDVVGGVIMDYATFEIKRGHGITFDFTLTVEAKVEINETVDL